MSLLTFAQYTSAVRHFNGDARDNALLMQRDGDVEVYYAPFDWVNPQARVLLVGITPGAVQATKALREAQAALRAGCSDDEVLRRAKLTGGFSGAMRPNLTAMLDSIGLHKWLGVSTCERLFEDASHLMQTASVLQYPVFVGGENYNGTPDPTKNPLLRSLLLEHFGAVAKALPNAVLVPMGPVPTKALRWLQSQSVISGERVLEGLPHPSGANAERISYFLGRKDRGALSAKTDPQKLDQAKAALIAAVARM